LGKNLIAKREIIVKKKKKERGKINGNLKLKGYMHTRGQKLAKLCMKRNIVGTWEGKNIILAEGKTRPWTDIETPDLV
jgi:hypothetical protein